jgi:hypothetical protein
MARFTTQPPPRQQPQRLTRRGYQRAALHGVAPPRLPPYYASARPGAWLPASMHSHVDMRICDVKLHSFSRAKI